MDAHTLHQVTDGKPGLDLMDLTTRQAAALRVVGSAVSWRMEQEAERLRKESLRKGGARGS